MLIVKLAILERVFCSQKMVTSTAFATRFGGSVCPEIPWSVCPETVGQLAPKWCGLIHHNLHFKEVSENKFSIEQIWKRAREKGLACNKSTFWLALRNPVYCGKIVIPKYKDEDTYWVQGVHEPLISESLYYYVQETLDGRKKRKERSTKIVSLETLPLRGFLTCPKCNKTLSGSASKGCRQYYHYYHCTSICGFRTRAEEANEIFVEGLRDYKLNSLTAELFKSVIVDAYQNISKSERVFRKQYIDQITLLTNKTTRARELLLNGDIDSTDYKSIKTESELKIKIVETKISELNNEFISLEDMNDLVDKAIDTLTKIDVIYCESDNETKRRLISSIYPEKFTLENLKFRTIDLSYPFKIIYLINNELSNKKSETTASKLALSRGVLPTRFELISMVPETIILSIELRKQYAANIYNQVLLLPAMYKITKNRKWGCY
jgi:site-specific DNA recombinase